MTTHDPANSRTLRDPDAFYEALIDAHAGLDGEASHRLNARLILLMAEQIGDDERLHALLEQAAGQGPHPAADS